MRPSSLFAASASLLSLVHARIAGIGVPSTIKPGDTFELVIENEIYIQSVTDVAMAVGYAAGSNPAGDGLGIFVTAIDLGEYFLELNKRTETLNPFPPSKKKKKKSLEKKKVQRQTPS